VPSLLMVRYLRSSELRYQVRYGSEEVAQHLMLRHLASYFWRYPSREDGEGREDPDNRVSQ
jgi:hypothetical protein